jgi:hypothetical protein
MSQDKYEGPHDWLYKHVQDAAGKYDIQDLVNIIHCLGDMVDGDQIQGVFQDDMAYDGYFDNEDDEEDEEGEDVSG